MEAFEPKWVNSILYIIGVNVFRLGGLHFIVYFISLFYRWGSQKEECHACVLSVCPSDCRFYAIRTQAGFYLVCSQLDWLPSSSSCLLDRTQGTSKYSCSYHCHIVHVIWLIPVSRAGNSVIRDKVLPTNNSPLYCEELE